MNHPAGDGALRGVLKNFLLFVRWFFGWCKLPVPTVSLRGAIHGAVFTWSRYHILGGMSRCGVDLDEAV